MSEQVVGTCGPSSCVVGEDKAECCPCRVWLLTVHCAPCCAPCSLAPPIRSDGGPNRPASEHGGRPGSPGPLLISGEARVQGRWELSPAGKLGTLCNSVSLRYTGAALADVLLLPKIAIFIGVGTLFKLGGGGGKNFDTKAVIFSKRTPYNYLLAAHLTRARPGGHICAPIGFSQIAE